MPQRFFDEKEHFRIFQGLFDWIRKRRYILGPYGRFKFARSSPRPSLSASTIALLDIYDYFGLLKKLSCKQKRQWSDYTRLFQDRETGFFIDRSNRRGISCVDWSGVEEYDTTRALDALTVLKSEPIYPVKGKKPLGQNDKFQKVDSFLFWARNLKWKENTWGPGTALQQGITLAKSVAPAEEFIKIKKQLFDFILGAQNRDTGLWSAGKGDLEKDISGTYKIIIILGDLNLSLPRRELLQQTVLEFFWRFNPKHMCFLRNSLCLVTEVLAGERFNQERMIGPVSFYNNLSLPSKSFVSGREEICKRVLPKAAQLLMEFKQSDGGFSFTRNFATSHHNGVILCRGRKEGDFLAASNAAFCHVCISKFLEWNGCS